MTSRHFRRVPFACGLLWIVVGSWRCLDAQETGYRLPLVVGPQATAWRLLAGSATSAKNCLELRGGTALILSEYRFGDCVLELNYRALGPATVEPIFYIRADAAANETAVSGPSVRLRRPSAAPRSLLRRARSGPAIDYAWKHLRIEVVGQCAAVWVDEHRVATLACAARETGLLAHPRRR